MVVDLEKKEVELLVTELEDVQRASEEDEGRPEGEEPSHRRPFAWRSGGPAGAHEAPPSESAAPRSAPVSSRARQRRKSK